LNATFGNAVELILGMIALKEGLVRVVQGNAEKKGVIFNLEIHHFTA